MESSPAGDADPSLRTMITWTHVGSAGFAVTSTRVADVDR
jgi:hypothetical protein